jgi:hypothetical protein
MFDISSSRIHEDAIVFSTRKLNAYNATIHRGSIIILSGNHSILRDVLKYKQSTINKNTDPTDSNSRVGATVKQYDLASALTSSLSDEDFCLVEVNDMRVLQSTCPPALSNKHADSDKQGNLAASQGAREVPSTRAMNLQMHNDDRVPLPSSFVVTGRTPMLRRVGILRGPGRLLQVSQDGQEHSCCGDNLAT